MEKLEINAVIERGNPNVLYQFMKDGEVVTWDNLTVDDRRMIVSAFAGGYGLFSGHIGYYEESEKEVQLR